MNKKTKKKVIILSIVIALLLGLFSYLTYLAFFADKQLKDMGYSYKEIQALKDYGVEDEVTKFNQSLVYALNSKEFKKENIHYYILLESNMDLTLVCNKLAEYYSIDEINQLRTFLTQENVELLAEKKEVKNIPVLQRMLEVGYNLDIAVEMTNSLPEENIEAFFKVAAKLEKPELYLSYLKNGYKDSEIQIIASLGNTDFNNLANIRYFASLTTLIKTSGFKTANLARYLMYMSKNNVAASVAVKKVNANADIVSTDKINYTEAYQPEGNATVNGILTLVNKSHKLLSTYEPTDLADLPAQYRYSVDQLSKEAADAFVEMAVACKADHNNVNLMIYNGYQSYNKLDELYNNALTTFENNIELTDKTVVKAGYSEHQTGLAADIGTDKYAPDKISISKSSTWLKSNSYRFGFIQRYPSGKETFTLTKSNIYHYRYVGKDASYIIHAYNWCYEEYYYLFVSSN